MTQIKTINLNGEKVQYILNVKSVKNINLRINCNGVFVSANKTVSIKIIESFLVKHEDFILKNIKKMKNIKKAREKNYVSGEEFRFLGKTLILIVEKSVEEKIRINTNCLVLMTKFTDNKEKKEKMINKFYLQKSNVIFNEIISKVYPIFEKMKIIYPAIKIRTMKTKWGSCMPYKNQINLNLKLVERSVEEIEYVILHEFCHFIHPNHSKHFYSLLEKLMPDWKFRKNLLKLP